MSDFAVLRAACTSLRLQELATSIATDVCDVQKTIQKLRS